MVKRGQMSDGANRWVKDRAADGALQRWIVTITIAIAAHSGACVGDLPGTPRPATLPADGATESGDGGRQDDVLTTPQRLEAGRLGPPADLEGGGPVDADAAGEGQPELHLVVLMLHTPTT